MGQRSVGQGGAHCALMGTVVRAGSATGVVVATGSQAEFGRIAVGLGQGQPETEFQAGLRKFSMLLVQVAAVLTTAIFIINVALHKPVMSALLFSLAIAVGITPQLLPAVVSTSLAAGSRQLARSKVLVKRLVCIEDLGRAKDAEDHIAAARAADHLSRGAGTPPRHHHGVLGLSRGASCGRAYRGPHGGVGG
jgi:magnesium-transporting ATPase (P-type)